jgi:phosphinothricin acetyltransferase
LGAEVLQYCLDRAPTLGIKTLLGFIFAHNEPSLKLFEGLGFATWGHLPNIAVLDGAEKSLKIVGKRIA